MRTKTLALSALVGVLGTAAALAQTVYSVNTVGYINLTFPANSYTIFTVPLVCSPDNTLNTVLPNVNHQYNKAKVYSFAGGTYGVTEVGVGTGINPTGWQTGGADVTLGPGSACFFYNSTTAAMSATVVGQVPSVPATNTLTPGWNLVGSILPASGDISTNPVSALTNFNKQDFVYTYDPTNGGYSQKTVALSTLLGVGYSNGHNRWGTPGDPSVDQVGYGFFYWNNQTTNEQWIENFVVTP